jgi:hypothetical protein
MVSYMFIDKKGVWTKRDTNVRIGEFYDSGDSGKQAAGQQQTTTSGAYGQQQQTATSAYGQQLTATGGYGQQQTAGGGATTQQNPADTPAWIWDPNRRAYYWINTATREYVYQDGTRIGY